MTQDKNAPLQEASDDFEIDLGVPETDVSSTEHLNLDLDLDGHDEGASEDEMLLNLGAVDEPEVEPEAEQSEEEAASEEAVLAKLRERLRAELGDWYVIHTYSGMENRVKQNLDARVQTLGMEDYIFETIVPTEEVVEIRNGVRKTVTRTVLPGYVLVRMELTDESWAAVRHTPSVTGFVAHASSPVPLSLEEVEKLLAPAALAKAAADETGPAPRKKKIEVADFTVGDSVMVVQGPFSGVHATITEINVNSQRLKALVEILGRETPVDLTFAQVQKD